MEPKTFVCITFSSVNVLEGVNSISTLLPESIEFEPKLAFDLDVSKVLLELKHYKYLYSKSIFKQILKENDGLLNGVVGNLIKTKVLEDLWYKRLKSRDFFITQQGMKKFPTVDHIVFVDISSHDEISGLYVWKIVDRETTSKEFSAIGGHGEVERLHIEFLGEQDG